MPELFGLTKQERHLTGWKMSYDARKAPCWVKLVALFIELGLIGLYALLFWLYSDPLHHGFFVASVLASAVAYTIPLYFENARLHFYTGESLFVHLLHISVFAFMWFVFICITQVRLERYAFGQDPIDGSEDERNNFTLYNIGIAVFLAIFAVAIFWKAAWICAVGAILLFVVFETLPAAATVSIAAAGGVLLGALCGFFVLDFFIPRCPDDALKGNIMDFSRHFASSFSLVLSVAFVHHENESAWLGTYIHGRLSDYGLLLGIGTGLAILRIIIDVLMHTPIREYVNGKSPTEIVSGKVNPTPSTGARKATGEKADRDDDSNGHEAPMISSSGTDKGEEEESGRTRLIQRDAIPSTTASSMRYAQQERGASRRAIEEEEAATQPPQRRVDEYKYYTVV